MTPAVSTATGPDHSPLMPAISFIPPFLQGYSRTS